MDAVSGAEAEAGAGHNSGAAEAGRDTETGGIAADLPAGRSATPLAFLTCAECRRGYSVPLRVHRKTAKRGARTFFCSRSCKDHSQRIAPDASTVQAKSIPEPNSGCWLWTGAINPGNGYGRLGHRGAPAHRISYEASTGSIPAGMVVRHRCDNPLCVNPGHLVVGTPADNKADSVSRRRHAHGSRTASARLTEEDIPIIRSRLRAGDRQTDIARVYGVTTGAIWRISSEMTWRHVP